MGKTSEYRVAMIGFGSVGRGLAQILQQRGDWLAQRYGLRLTLVAVSTRSWGTYYDVDGLDLTRLLEAGSSAGEDARPLAQPWAPLEMIDAVDADVLIEASATDLHTGEPATSYVRAALRKGMHVVTANKGPIALHGRELRELAQSIGVRLGYEGTVMSGTPALRLGWGALAGCELREISGIVNGTTNYILTQMECGMPYAEALVDAQRLGYAEADPTGDVEGHDAAAKVVILANMLMDANITLDAVNRVGITQLTPQQIGLAQAAGERWKLIARVAREGGRVTASVRPTPLPLSHPLAGVSGATNAITFTADLLGDVTLIGPGAGGIATGFALLSDILLLRDEG